jgi:hypothetical protein
MACLLRRGSNLLREFGNLSANLPRRHWPRNRSHYVSENHENPTKICHTAVYSAMNDEFRIFFKNDVAGNNSMKLNVDTGFDHDIGIHVSR